VPYALLFPGQASQQVGMDADFRRLSAEAGRIFARTDEVAELPVSRVIADGPLELLTETQFAQPAVVATSLAALAAFREQAGAERLPRPAFCAGHSVGELAAVAAADGIDVDTALELVARRSRYMLDACRAVDGTMAAVIGLCEAAVSALCAEATRATGRVVELANLNAPDQLVVSGHTAAIEWLREHGPRHGARRVLPLKVGGPFHSSYMRRAAEAFALDVAVARIRPPAVPVVLNRDAAPTCDPAAIRAELAAGVAAPVRWADSLRAMAAAGCQLFVEVGPGKVLAGLVRRTLPGARVAQVDGAEALRQTVQAVRELEEHDEA
jgi:[acyl-carrier-protein] S-malonyltransferase